MVRRVEDQRVLEQTRIAQVLEEASHLGVYVVDQAVVRRPAVVERLRIEARPPVEHHLRVDALRHAVEARRPVADHRLGQRLAGVAVVEELRRRERRVGIDEADVEEEGRLGVARLEELDRLADAPEGVGLGLGEVGGAPDPAVGSHAVRHRPAVLGEAAVEPAQVVVVGAARAVRELEALEAVALALWEEVQLADHLGLVAGAGQLPRQRVRRVPGDAAGHPHHALHRRRLARHERAPRRDAGRRL